jgi:hypothetical protein
MIEVLLTTSTKVLEASPLLLPRTLHDLIANQAHVTSLHAGSVSDSWFLLQHTCHVDPLRRTQVTAGISAYALNSYRYVAHKTVIYRITTILSMRGYQMGVGSHYLTFPVPQIDPELPPAQWVLL